MRSTLLGKVNWGLLLCSALLCAAGLYALWAFAPPEWSDPKVVRNPFIRQATFAAIGMALLAITILPSYLHARRAAWFLYVVCMIALLSLLVFGRYTKGARGWFNVGPFMFQPAEFAKIAAVLALARYMMYQKNLDRWRGLLGPLAILAIPTGLIFVQPDFGTAALFLPVFFSMLWAAGARMKQVLALLLVLALAVPIGFRFGLEEYQRNRILSFAFPEKVSKDKRRQQEESVKSCGSGGWTGREEGGAYSFYIPHRESDFAYSILAEKSGFVGSTLVLLLFALFCFQSLRIAYLSREPFGRLVVVGLTTFVVAQVTIHVGMTLGVAPITGLTLPLVSYGGSSILSTFLSIGLIVNVGTRWIPSFSMREMTDPVEMSAFRPHESLRQVL